MPASPKRMKMKVLICITSFSVLIISTGVISFSPLQGVPSNLKSFNHFHLGNQGEPARTLATSTRINYRNPTDVENGNLFHTSGNDTAASILEQRVVSSRSTNRESSVVSIHSVQDYRELVLAEHEKLAVIRFHAPWCKVCQTTNVSYERHATKLLRSFPNRIKFFSVSVDGKEETNRLRELLDIRGVPMGIVYHPSVGVLGKVNMGRANFCELKKRIQRYLEGDDGDDIGNEYDLKNLIDGLKMGIDETEEAVI